MVASQSISWSAHDRTIWTCQPTQTGLTLNFRHSVIQNGLLQLLVTQAASDLLNDGSCELLLLSLTLLSFVADPGVEDGLDLSSQLGLLAKLECRLFCLGGLLCTVEMGRGVVFSACLARSPSKTATGPSACAHLCERKERLCDVDNVLLLRDVVDAALHSLGVLSSGSIEDVGEFLRRQSAITSATCEVSRNQHSKVAL